VSGRGSKPDEQLLQLLTVFSPASLGLQHPNTASWLRSPVVCRKARGHLRRSGPKGPRRFPLYV
jgi:hypothetical protein